MITIVDFNDNNLYCKLKDMKPLQIGEIIHNTTDINGSIIMRTASSKKYEVMNLSQPGIDNCWIGQMSEFEVRLLRKDAVVHLKISNEGVLNG